MSLPFEPADSALPRISVVIPVLNEARYIGTTLSGLVDQRYPVDGFEILVVDGGSSDNSVATVREIAAESEIRIRLLGNPDRWASSARNIGARQAGGDYILYLDAHVASPSPTLLVDMAKTAVERQALVLARPQPLNGVGLTVLQHAIAGARASPLGHSCESYIFSDHEGWVSPISVGVMYHRSLLASREPFDERFDAAEDVDFNYRLEKAGIKAFISPAFTVNYYPRATFPGLFRQMARYGKGRAAFGFKHPERFSLEMLAPALISLAPAVALGLVLWAPGFLLPGSLIGVAGYTAVACGSLRYVQAKRKRAMFLVPLCLSVIHGGLAYGLLKGPPLSG